MLPSFAGRNCALLLCSLLAAGMLLAPPLPDAAAQPFSAPSDYRLLDGARQGHCLRLGHRGADVMALQRALNATGCALWEDGIFLYQTWGAVRRFQASQGLKVDGVVGPNTVAALDRALGAFAPPTPGAGTGGGGGVHGTPRHAGGGTQIAGLPARPYHAVTGSEFLLRTNGLSRSDRESAILQELSTGNFPDFLRRFEEVTVRGNGGDGHYHTISVRVSPEYLAIGSDTDFVRIPMSSLTAQRFADQVYCSLPTRKLVDLVHGQAAVRLSPIPLVPGPLMMSNDYYAWHNRRIEAQRAGMTLGVLTAGHKKDVVISNRLLARPGRLAIYGWHWPDGRPIQPLSTVHYNGYADYSHGIRLCHRTVLVDGVAMDLVDVLRSPYLAPLLSDEGVMPSPRIPGA
ncbi:peptidoglycan-binding protein [Planctomycetota bacterium]